MATELRGEQPVKYYSPGSVGQKTDDFVSEFIADKYFGDKPIIYYVSSVNYTTLRNAQQEMKRSLVDVLRGKERFTLKSNDNPYDFCIYVTLRKLPAQALPFPETYKEMRVVVNDRRLMEIKLF